MDNMPSATKVQAYMDLIARGLANAHNMVNILYGQKQNEFIQFANGNLAARASLIQTINNQKTIYAKIRERTERFAAKSTNVAAREAIISFAKEALIASKVPFDQLQKELEGQLLFLNNQKESVSWVAFLRQSISNENAILLKLRSTTSHLCASFNLRVVLPSSDPRSQELENNKASQLLLALIKAAIIIAIPDQLEGIEIDGYISATVDFAHTISPAALWNICGSILGR